MTGCIVEKEYYRETFHEEIEALKRRHFEFDPDEGPLILHRKEIMQAKGHFCKLEDEAKRNDFDNGLIRLFSTLSYRLIIVVIDKLIHAEKYRAAAFHPYHYCLNALLERYCYLLQNSDSTGDVVAESRSGTPDEQLKRAYIDMYQHGSNLQRAEFFQRRITSGQIKLKRKESNVAGLQFADLLAVPSKREVLLEHGRIEQGEIEDFDRRVWRAIRTKYHCKSSDGTIDKFGRYLL